MAGCIASSCGSSAQKRDMCSRHYQAWRKATPKEDWPARPSHLDEASRFWAKVEKVGHGACWMWTGAQRASGHGQALLGGKAHPAQAVALVLTGSPRPGDAWALHRCDNPPCVNPAHVYWGTPQDNANDAWARGLMPVAEERAAAILSNAAVIEIRHKYAAGALGADLAVEYGIAKTTVYQITSGTKWKTIGGPRTRRRTPRKAPANG